MQESRGLCGTFGGIRRGAGDAAKKASDSQEHMVTEVDGEQTGAGIDSGKKG